MKVIVIIPARSGSKSLPNKNILPLNGIPLLCYSVSYALKCNLVSRVVVSTDSEEFAEIARSCGADVPFIRPAEYAMDSSRDYSFMRHALDYYDSIGHHCPALRVPRADTRLTVYRPTQVRIG